MAAVGVANQLPVQVWFCTCPQKARMSKCTKFSKDISFHGWVMTTSGFRKRTAAILKFYFRFQLWHADRHQRLILRRHTKFHVNQTIGGVIMTSLKFSRWRKKDRTGKKVTKGLYFTYLGRSPHPSDLHQKLCSRWYPRRNHVCQVSKWNFQGLPFYRGSNFPFSYWYLNGPYNSTALLRCLCYCFTDHLISNKLLNPHQSAYCKHHSTETALLYRYIHDHLINAIGSQQLSWLCLLDLSAAFDTVDHSILLTRLSSWCGIHGSVLNWSKSLLVISLLPC